MQHLSSEQLHAAHPRYRALLKALGTADDHSTALQHHLRASGNTHEASHTPANPAATIRRSHGPDPLLRDVPKRKPVAQGMRRTRDETEDEALSRISEARTQIANNAGSNLSKAQGSAFGAFQRMRTRFQAAPAALAKALRIGSDAEMAAAAIAVLNSIYGPRSAALTKAVGTEHGESFDARYGTRHEPEQRARAVSVSAAAKPVTKPAQSLTKSLAKAQAALAAMGFSKSLTASTGSDSATLAGGSAIRRQSPDKSRVFGTTVAGDAVAKPKPRLLSKSEVQTACLSGLKAGSITAAEAQHVDTALSMDRRLPDELLKRITDIHNGK